MHITLLDVLYLIPADEYVSIRFGERSNTMNGKVLLLLGTLNENALNKKLESISSDEGTILTITVRGE